MNDEKIDVFRYNISKTMHFFLQIQILVNENLIKIGNILIKRTETKLVL